MSVSFLSKVFCTGLVSLTLTGAHVLAQEASDQDKDTSSKSTATSGKSTAKSVAKESTKSETKESEKSESKESPKSEAKQSASQATKTRDEDSSLQSREDLTKSREDSEKSTTRSTDRGTLSSQDKATSRSDTSRNSVERNAEDRSNRFRFDQSSSEETQSDKNRTGENRTDRNRAGENRSEENRADRNRPNRRGGDDDDQFGTPPGPPNERDAFNEEEPESRTLRGAYDENRGQDRNERRFSSDTYRQNRSNQDRSNRFRNRFGDRDDRDRNRDDDRDFARSDDDRRDDDRQENDRDYARRDADRRDNDRDYARSDDDRRDDDRRDDDRTDDDRDYARNNRDGDRDRDLDLGVSIRVDDSDRLVIQERYSRGLLSSANVRPGDVIVSVNNQPIRSQQALLRLIRYHDGRGAMPIVVIRDGSQQTIYYRDVSQAGYEEYQEEYVWEDDEQAWLGVHLNARYKNSAVVESVQEGSAASEAGLKPNDWIVSVNNQRIMSAQHLSQVIRDMEPGEQIRMNVSRRVTGELQATLTDRPGYSSTNQDERPERTVNYEE